MGYTHYWYRPKTLDKNKFKAAAEDCKKVCDLLAHEGLLLESEFPSPNPSELVRSGDFVYLNGKGDEGYETFLIEQEFTLPYSVEKEGKYFAFCKTARRPYDAAVTACLIIFHHHFGDDFIVKSDGTYEEWQEGYGAVWRAELRYEIPDNIRRKM